MMTKEEAIKILKEERWYMSRYSEEYKEAYDMAIEALQEQTTPTIPTFKESAEAYKAWTGEEMGKTSDEINEMNNEIIKDILKMMPTAYLLEALGVSTFEELTEPADRPHGEWIVVAYQKDGEEYIRSCTCSECGSKSALRTNYCPNCGAKMGGDGE